MPRHCELWPQGADIRPLAYLLMPAVEADQPVDRREAASLLPHAAPGSVLDLFEIWDQYTHLRTPGMAEFADASSARLIRREL
jgi:hypothetical protein